MNNIGTVLAVAIIFILGIGIIGLFIAWPIQWLWNNCLMGSIEGINTISFWDAYGIYLLSNLILHRDAVYTKNK